MQYHGTQNFTVKSKPTPKELNKKSKSLPKKHMASDVQMKHRKLARFVRQEEVG